MQVDVVIAPIIYSLHRNPLAHYETGIANTRLARTKLRLNNRDIVLSHLVWFTADEKNKCVTLLWIEVASPEDMDFYSDDEIPF